MNVNNESVALLIEKEAVVRVLSQYARGIDRKDAELYRSCLANPIDVDVGEFGGVGMKADDWVAEAFGIADGYTSTQHIITNHEVEFPNGPDGDEARCRAYLQAQHWRAEESMLLGGRYDHKLRKEAGTWRIYKVGLKVDWVHKERA